MVRIDTWAVARRTMRLLEETVGVVLGRQRTPPGPRQCLILPSTPNRVNTSALPANICGCRAAARKSRTCFGHPQEVPSNRRCLDVPIDMALPWLVRTPIADGHPTTV